MKGYSLVPTIVYCGKCESFYKIKGKRTAGSNDLLPKDTPYMTLEEDNYNKAHLIKMTLSDNGKLFDIYLVWSGHRDNIDQLEDQVDEIKDKHYSLSATISWKIISTNSPIGVVVHHEHTSMDIVDAFKAFDKADKFPHDNKAHLFADNLFTTASLAI